MISPTIRRQLQEKLEQARQLSAQRPCDHRRVHALLAECLTADLGNTIYIDAMLQNLRWRYGQRGRGSWLSVWLGHREFDRAAKTRDWPRVLQLGPAALASNPWNVTVLRTLAEACAALDFPHAELRYLQAAIEAQPHDEGTLRQLARSLARLGQYDEASEQWKKLLDLHADDVEAARALRELIPDAAARFEVEERRLNEDLAKSGGDLRLRERLEDLAIHRSRHKLVIAEQRAAAEPGDDASELVRQLQAEHNRLELGLYHTRCERYPNQPELKLELALRLKRAGNFSGAIEQLEQARQHGDLAPSALIELGECWQHLRQFDKALAFYRQGLERLGPDDASEPAKLALYRCGTLAAALGQTHEGMEYLQRLVAVDPAYKNARQRLDKMAEICDKT